MARLVALAIRSPTALLTVAAALSLLAVAGIVDPWGGSLRLRIDPSVEGLLPSEGPSRDHYDRVQRLFGEDEAIVVALTGRRPLGPRSLARVAELTAGLEALAGVRSVLSLATAHDVRDDAGSLSTAPFLAPLPGSAAEAARLRARVAANPLAGHLLSRDGRTAAIYATLDPAGDVSATGTEIARVVRAGAGDLEIAVSGAPHVKARTSAALVSSLARVLPAIFAIVAVLLFFAFRSGRGVWVPLSTIGLSLLWTLGTIGWLDRSLDLVTSLVPPLVVILGFAYSMHVLSEYFDIARDAAPEDTPSDVVLRSLEATSIPVVLTGCTTAVGLLSLTLSPIEAIRSFGLLAALGVIYAAGISLLLVPTALRLLPVPRATGRRLEGTLLSRWAYPIADFAFFKRRWIIGSSLALCVVALVLASRVEVGTDYIENFREGSEVRVDYEAINTALDGATTFFVVLDSPVADAFARPDHQAEIRDLEEWLEEQPEVGASRSVVDYLMVLNRAAHGNDDAYFVPPSSKRLAMQLLFLGPSDLARRLVDPSLQTTVLVVRSRVQNSARISRLRRRIDERLAALPHGIEGEVTGQVVLLSEAVDGIARGQLQSLAVAGGVVYLLLAAMFTSFRVGLVALFPNALPIAVYFGAMGALGVPLSPSTSLVACIALGVAVDDTIHYFARFNRDAKRAAKEVPATKSALRAVIRPVSFTSLGLCAGFAALLGSELQSQASFGLLAAGALAVAWLADLTLTPALCSCVRIVTLWDVLRLDLGEVPHRCIALFAGLGLRQARVVALMGSIEEWPKDAELCREGELGQAMFVVLDGELVECVDGPDGLRVELETLSRGDLVGAAGLFTERRSTDVIALTPVRLLRITRPDLDRLRGRYPRIAAGVYHNLSCIQAELLATVAGELQHKRPDRPRPVAPEGSVTGS